MPLPDDTEQILDLVVDDVRRGLTGLASIESAEAMLAADDPDRAAELREPPVVHVPEAYRADPAVSRNLTFAAVPWVAIGVHTGSIADFGPTGRRLVVQGITIVQSVERPDEPGEPDGLRFHRQVDWLGVHQQLGTVAAKRRPSNAPPVAAES